MITSILLILFGAVATGAFQLVFNIRDRKHESETILTAIASEVDSICRLIRHQRYLEFASEVAATIRAGTWDGTALIVDVRENYFSVYEGLAAKLGMLRPTDAAKIVNFYAYCKSVIDSTRADGVNATGEVNHFTAGNLLSLETMLTAVLTLGNEIIKLPKVSIHETLSEPKLPQIEPPK